MSDDSFEGFPPEPLAGAAEEEEFGAWTRGKDIINPKDSKTFHKKLKQNIYLYYEPSCNRKTDSISQDATAGQPTRRLDSARQATGEGGDEHDASWEAQGRGNGQFARLPKKPTTSRLLQFKKTSLPQANPSLVSAELKKSLVHVEIKSDAGLHEDTEGRVTLQRDDPKRLEYLKNVLFERNLFQKIASNRFRYRDRDPLKQTLQQKGRSDSLDPEARQAGYSDIEGAHSQKPLINLPRASDSKFIKADVAENSPPNLSAADPQAKRSISQNQQFSSHRTAENSGFGSQRKHPQENRASNLRELRIGAKYLYATPGKASEVDVDPFKRADSKSRESRALQKAAPKRQVQKKLFPETKASPTKLKFIEVLRNTPFSKSKAKLSASEENINPMVCEASRKSVLFIDLNERLEKNSHSIQTPKMSSARPGTVAEMKFESVRREKAAKDLNEICYMYRKIARLSKQEEALASNARHYKAPAIIGQNKSFRIFNSCLKSNREPNPQGSELNRQAPSVQAKSAAKKVMRDPNQPFAITRPPTSRLPIVTSEE